MKALVTLVFILATLPSLAQAWWNEDWAYRKKISLDAQQLQQTGIKIANEGLVLVRLHTGNFAYFADVAEAGKDLRFIANDDKTPLKYAIEKFDALNEMALIWVRLPKDLASSAEPAFWMYYKNPKAVDAQDAPGIFDVAQLVAYHFDGSAVKDATAYGNQPSSATNSTVDNGVAGSAAGFDGNQDIRIAASPSIQMMLDFGWTVSAWVKIEQAQTDGVIFERDGLVLSVRGQTPVLNLNRKEIVSPFDLNLATWHFLAITGTNDGFTLFVDGKPAGTLPDAVSALQGDIAIGNALSGGRGWVGGIDEFGIAKAAREQNALQFAAALQGQSAELLIYGEDSSPDAEQGGSESRIMATLGDVTLDGWVIIGMLAVMLLVSWIVMITKALVLNKNSRENKRLEDAFLQLQAADIGDLNRSATADDADIEASPLLSLMGSHGRFAGSSIYNLYHVGVEELNKRLLKAAGADVAEQSLSDKAITSIRAAMESVLVREIQKLNSQMVLLTIAISGGPFLGLLGTVLGVMITFGDIAASGEVNVNAIAPGIAAALATTVAGLLVAIPALFGYNWLASQIKLITADMYIFVDEFSAKLSERYS